MNKVKITVLKTTLDKDLAAEYGVEGLGACPMLREGRPVLRRLRKTGRPLRRGVESDLSVCLCAGARRRSRRLLSRRLDQNARRRHLQLQ